jgi:hypothetical protein
MNKKPIRRSLFILASLICAGCWIYTFGSLLLLGHPGAAKWTAMVTTSVIATEVLFWVGAFTMGWSIFESRSAIWKRFTKGRAA